MGSVKVKWLRAAATLLLAATFAQSAAVFFNSNVDDNRESAICSNSAVWGNSTALQQSTQKQSSSLAFNRDDNFFAPLEIAEWPLNTVAERFHVVHLLACTTATHRAYASRAPPVFRA
jgi:hypothetical protein